VVPFVRAVLKILVGVTPINWLTVCDPFATSKPLTSGETPAANNGERPLLTLTIEVPRVARSIFLLNERSLEMSLRALLEDMLEDMDTNLTRATYRRNTYAHYLSLFFWFFPLKI
jgi:hypothetical protein